MTALKLDINCDVANNIRFIGHDYNFYMLTNYLIKNMDSGSHGN